MSGTEKNAKIFASALHLARKNAKIFATALILQFPFAKYVTPECCVGWLDKTTFLESLITHLRVHTTVMESLIAHLRVHATVKISRVTLDEGSDLYVKK